MRALLCAEAFCRLSRTASMRLSRSLDCLPGTEKFARKRFTHFVRNTISLCLTTLLVTIFVFLICTLDPGWKGIDQPWLRSDHMSLRSRPGRVLQSTSSQYEEWRRSTALHGMGVVFRKGTRSMNELVVAHLEETTTPDDLRLFLRTLHRSGVTARADVALLFPSSPLPKKMAVVVAEEEKSWWQLMLEHQSTAPAHTRKDTKESSTEGTLVNEGRTLQDVGSDSVNVEFPKLNSTVSVFHAMAYWKAREEGKPRGDAFWGSSTLRSEEMAAAVDWGDWGSMVAFEMQDLDSDDALKGFIEEPPARLRRWISYQILLGMVKSKYRNVLLTAVGEVLVIGDVFSGIRKKAFDSGLILYQEDQTWNEFRTARNDVLKNNALAAEEASSVGRRQELSEEMNEHTHIGAESDSKGVEALGKKISSSTHVGSIDIERPEMQFIEEVYGKEKWKFLEEEDKERPVLGTGLIMGCMKPVRSLLSTMSTEIVGVAALVRKSRQSFHDRPLLNFLVHKSSVLSKRVTDKLHVMTNMDSSVHSLPGSKQRSIFFKANGVRYAALQGLKDELVVHKTYSAISRTIYNDICSSQGESKFYPDCSSSDSRQLLGSHS